MKKKVYIIPSIKVHSLDDECSLLESSGESNNTSSNYGGGTSYSRYSVCCPKCGKELDVEINLPGVYNVRCDSCNYVFRCKFGDSNLDFTSQDSSDHYDKENDESSQKVQKYSVKCPHCGKTFVAETTKSGKFKYKCPFCGGIVICQLGDDVSSSPSSTNSQMTNDDSDDTSSNSYDDYTHNDSYYQSEDREENLHIRSIDYKSNRFGVTCPLCGEEVIVRINRPGSYLLKCGSCGNNFNCEFSNDLKFYKGDSNSKHNKKKPTKKSHQEKNDITSSDYNGGNMYYDDAFSNAIKEAIELYGIKILLDVKVANILSDLHAYKHIPSSKYVIRTIVTDGYINKLLKCKERSLEVDRLENQFIKGTGFQKDVVDYVFSSIIRALSCLD